MRVAVLFEVLTAFGVFAGIQACAKHEPRLEYGQVHSRAMGRAMEYSVYVPRDMPKDARLPLVVFLHGGGDGPDSFDEAGVGQALDEAISSGALPPVVVVNPDGETGFWENWYDGTHLYEDWVLDDLVPYIRGTLPVGRCPEACFVMGVSMGGYGALRFSLHRNEMFNAVAAISAPILTTDQMIDFADKFFARWLLQSRRVFGPTEERERIAKEDLYLRWTSQADLGDMRLFLSWGSADRERIIRSNEAFVAHLTDAQIKHHAVEYPGEHKWVDWKPLIIELLREMLVTETQGVSGPPSR